MCKLCLSPTNRDLLLMVLVYTIVAILMLTVSGCSDEPLVRHQAPVDSGEYTFDEIADVIQLCWEEL